MQEKQEKRIKEQCHTDDGKSNKKTSKYTKGRKYRKTDRKFQSAERRENEE